MGGRRRLLLRIERREIYRLSGGLRHLHLRTPQPGDSESGKIPAGSSGPALPGTSRSVARISGKGGGRHHAGRSAVLLLYQRRRRGGGDVSEAGANRHRRQMVYLHGGRFPREIHGSHLRGRQGNLPGALHADGTADPACGVRKRGGYEKGHPQSAGSGREGGSRDSGADPGRGRRHHSARGISGRSAQDL